jgi:hypothetical protein
VFPPGGGTKTSRTVASILTGRDDSLPLILLDGDAMGARMQTELKSSLYKEEPDSVLSTDNFSGIEKSEVEDLFPQALVADVVDRWLRAPGEDFGSVVKVGEPIIPQIEAWAQAEAVELATGWKVDLAKLVKKRALAEGVEKIPEEVRERWIKLFEALDG